MDLKRGQVQMASCISDHGYNEVVSGGYSNLIGCLHFLGKTIYKFAEFKQFQERHFKCFDFVLCIREEVISVLIGSWGDKGILITDSSTQPASSSHPEPQHYQDQRFSRGRGIFGNIVSACVSTFYGEIEPIA